MKKISLSALAILFATGLYAQSLYFGIGAGYLMQTNKTSSLGFTANSITATDISGSTTGLAQVNNFSLGGGIPIHIDLGIQFNNNVSASLNFSYLIGESVEIANVEGSQEVDPGDVLASSVIGTAQAKQARLAPSVTISNGFDKDISLFASLGLLMPVGGSTFSEQNEVEPTSPGTSMTTFTKIESNGAFSVGFTGAVGIQYFLSDIMAISAEIQHVNLSVKTDSDEIIEMTVDGASNLGKIPNYYKKSTYHDELSHTMNTDYFNGTPDMNKAHEGLRTESSYSGIGLILKLILTPFN